MSNFFNILNSIVTLYMMLIFLRIMLSWFGGIESMGKPAEVLASITDPYLNLFRKLQFLRMGFFDFSPIMGIIVLSIVSNVLGQLSRTGQVTVGLLLGLFTLHIFSALGFFALIFMVMAIIRLIGLSFNVGNGSRLMITLDAIFQPIVFRMAARFFSGRTMQYTSSVGILTAGLAGIFLLSQFLGPIIAGLFLLMPF
ncbi:YggT family protein [Spirochaeta dissipatitropha]